MEGAVITRKINFLLLAIPLVLFSGQLQSLIRTYTGLAISSGVRYGVTFALAAVALIPLAGFVESAVEELAELLGPFVGCLLHTTFGNVAELTIGLAVLLSFVGSGGACPVHLKSRWTTLSRRRSLLPTPRMPSAP